MTQACSIAARFNSAVLDPLVALLFAVGLLLFVYGVVEFMFFQRTGDKGEYKSKGREHMLWGVIGMAIMLAGWGIIRVVASTFGLPLNTC